MKKRILITLFIILIASQAAFTEYIESNESIFSKYIQPEELNFKYSNYDFSNYNNSNYNNSNYDNSNYDNDEIRVATSLNFTALNGFSGFTIQTFDENFSCYVGMNFINLMSEEDITEAQGFSYDAGHDVLYIPESSSLNYTDFRVYDYKDPKESYMSISIGTNFNFTQNFSFMYGLDFRFIVSRYIYGELEYEYYYDYYYGSYTERYNAWIKEDNTEFIKAISPQLGFNYIYDNVLTIFGLLQFDLSNETVDGILGIGVFF